MAEKSEVATSHYGSRIKDMLFPTVFALGFHVLWLISMTYGAAVFHVHVSPLFHGAIAETIANKPNRLYWMNFLGYLAMSLASLYAFVRRKHTSE